LTNQSALFSLSLCLSVSLRISCSKRKQLIRWGRRWGHAKRILSFHMGVFFSPLASRSLSFSLPPPAAAFPNFLPLPPPGFPGPKAAFKETAAFSELSVTKWRQRASEPASPSARSPTRRELRGSSCLNIITISSPSVADLLHLCSPNSLSFFPYLQEWHTNSAS
jgi:hypothetical protein